MVLAKFSLRHVLARPGRAILTMLSIVIGVAAAVSVSMSTSTTRLAYKEMFATLTGRAAFEVAAEGGGTCDESLVKLIEDTPGVAVAVPIIQRSTALYGARKVKVLVLGIDPQKDQYVHDYTLNAGQFLSDDGGMMLEVSFARDLGLELGDEVSFLAPRRLRGDAQLVGLLEPSGVTALRMGNLMFLPLKRAQRLFARPGVVDTIQVVVDETADERKVEAELASRLPEGISVRRPMGRNEQVDEILMSSEQALRLTTAFSLLLAAFIILNTFLMNVGERRQQLAIMRAIGATRRQMTRLLLGESMVMGAIGTVLGIGVGLLGAYLLTLALGKLLLVSLPTTRLTMTPFLFALGFGFGAALLGAAIPARRAGKLSPLEGMRPVVHADSEGMSHKFTVVGTLLVLGSGTVLAGCILGYLPMKVSVGAAVCLLIGVVLLLPNVLRPLSRITVVLLRPLMRVEARLAQRQILRHYTRSTLTVGVLFIAAATGVGMANSILDNVQDVRNWARQAIVGDFFIRALMPDATMTAPMIPEALDPEIRKIPGISSVDTSRFQRAYVVMPPANGGKQDELAATVIARDFVVDAPVYFDLRGGDPEKVHDQIMAGEVVIGTVLAQRTGLGVGDALTIKTLQGPKDFRIAGLTNEYMVGGLAVFMHRAFAGPLLGAEGVDAYIIRAKPEQREEVRQRLKSLCEENRLLLYSFDDIERIINGMIAGIDACLWGILVLGFVVAAFGLVNTLTMNVLEQTRELGMMRIVAMTRRQVRRTILSQAIIIGAIGLVPGTIAGIGVAYLINLGTLPALGHPVAFGFHPWMLLIALVGAFAIVLLGALLPAERAARLELQRALQYE